MKQLKAEMQWMLGCRLFEKIKRTAVVRELGLLVDEKETRRSKARSEVEWEGAEQTQLARHHDFAGHFEGASRSLLVSTDE